MGYFKSVKARQIFDSRGNPTVEVALVTDKGRSGSRKKSKGLMSRDVYRWCPIWSVDGFERSA